VFVLGNGLNATFWPRDVHWHDFFGKDAGLLRRGCFLLGAQSKAVLGSAIDLVLLRDVLRRFGHRRIPVHLDHARIREAPADSRIVDFRRSGESRRGLGHHEWGAAHALDAAGNGQRNLTGRNSPRGHGNRLHPRAA
jgi:hypothetical protein